MDRRKWLNKQPLQEGPVIYWMEREMRAHDNWALHIAQKQAVQSRQPLIVIVALPHPPKSLRQADFILKGLQEVESELHKKQISFTVLPSSDADILKFIKRYQPASVYCDFLPLKSSTKLKQAIANSIDCEMIMVDDHNIVPCWLASSKQEFAARTFRPKIHKVLKDWLKPCPSIQKHPHKLSLPKPDWNRFLRSLKVDNEINPVDWLKPGFQEAKKILNAFIKYKLSDYDQKRNDPNEEFQSNLSPYLHCGHISSRWIALEVYQRCSKPKIRESFLEELIVRKELSDNFCYYNPHYDSFEGFPSWALQTLNKHQKDKREYLYSFKTFEQANTHDDLWNAAQQQLVSTGKMHGFMRMYWAKKILEWSKDPKTAFKIALNLNDKYELDGSDPNGYVGIAWSIGGVHDRPWTERPIFGKIRFMNANGCKRKFDTEAYIETYLSS